jgi:hypothetical protein
LLSPVFGFSAPADAMARRAAARSSVPEGGGASVGEACARRGGGTAAGGSLSGCTGSTLFNGQHADRRLTFVEACGDLLERVQLAMAAACDGEAAREFSLARTALEEAQMRFTRGVAKSGDCFSPADLEAR